ncbi:DUF6686 family protein [Labilibacter marinus]|uniref:DUF6686 family protein n=1 Tax=Labilibacter marinus TaxID=1477105 RepID=UPI00094FA283|nr:DUF6686 family protein [Labilibacter marinus]
MKGVNMEIIDIKTLHGHIFTCDKCSKIHFEFNQLAINFSSLSIIEDFYSYLNKLEGDEFERINNQSQYIRKIQIPFPNTSIKMVLSKADLKELKILMQMFIVDYRELEQKSQLIKKLSHISEKQLN